MDEATGRPGTGQGEPRDDGAAGGSPPNALTDNAFGRLAGVLVSPAATFRSLRRRPTWVVAFLAVTLIVAAVQVFAVGKLDTSDLRDQIEEQLAARGQAPSGDDLDRAVDVQMKVGTGCGLVFMPLGMLVVALVFMVVLRMSGGEVSFVQSLATVAHAMVPLAVGALLAVPVLVAREVPFGVMEAQHGILASNLGAFAPEGASQVVMALLSSVDLFSLWVVVLLAIGFAAVAGVTRATAAVTSLALWAVWVAVKVGLAALGETLGGGGG